MVSAKDHVKLVFNESPFLALLLIINRIVMIEIDYKSDVQ